MAFLRGRGDDRFDFGIYSTEAPDRGFYGFISNIDDNVGRLMQKLEEWGMEEETLLCSFPGLNYRPKISHLCGTGLPVGASNLGKCVGRLLKIYQLLAP